jgi:hypothetical protein
MVMLAVYGIFGAFLGFLIYVFAWGGFRLLLAGERYNQSTEVIALLLCLFIGAGWGLFAYKYKHHEIGAAGSTFYHDQPTAILLSKRLLIIGTCLAGLYFLWQVAKGV